MSSCFKKLRFAHIWNIKLAIDSFTYGFKTDQANKIEPTDICGNDLF